MYVLCRIVPLSMTLSDPKPQFQGHSVVYRRISRKRCIRSTPCLVLGQGFRGRRIEWCYLRFDEIQDGGWRPSWMYTNGHNFATGLPIDVMFGSRVGFPAELRFLPQGPSYSLRIAVARNPCVSWAFLSQYSTHVCWAYKT